ncbi:hypothetical protein Pla52o_53340 [Novipirellula galeiformis]|uniref:Uncharacterized protein n=1 Tax=Novipirellula galeiformis TaxID=2528004 RepID=A0A5C6BZN6_9BACT|nr:hypothetical protein Pla52o_53340 [Novipirellula galeiformis]
MKISDSVHVGWKRVRLSVTISDVFPVASWCNRGRVYALAPSRGGRVRRLLRATGGIELFPINVFPINERFQVKEYYDARSLRHLSFFATKH